MDRGGAITSTVIPKSEVNRASIAAAVSGVPVGATHCLDLVYTAMFGECPSQSKSKGRPGLPRHYRGLGGLVHTPAACSIVPVIPISSPVVLSDRKGIDGACALKVVRATTGDDFIAAADLRCLVFHNVGIMKPLNSGFLFKEPLLSTS